jgi:haloalkane dehalogenase
MTHLGLDRLVLVAHDASGPPAIDWALDNPERVAALVLLNTYYGWMPSLRPPEAILLFSLPLVRNLARWLVVHSDTLDRRLYTWQVGRFISNPDDRRAVVTQLYEQFRDERSAFFSLNADLLGTTISRRRRFAEMRSFTRPGTGHLRCRRSLPERRCREAIPPALLDLRLVSAPERPPLPTDR